MGSDSGTSRVTVPARLLVQRHVALIGTEATNSELTAAMRRPVARKGRLKAPGNGSALEALG
jgi:hypothetical protein